MSDEELLPDDERDEGLIELTDAQKRLLKRLQKQAGLPNPEHAVHAPVTLYLHDDVHGQEDDGLFRTVGLCLHSEGLFCVSRFSDGRVFLRLPPTEDGSLFQMVLSADVARRLAEGLANPGDGNEPRNPT